jgi:hypothetical protein
MRANAEWRKYPRTPHHPWSPGVGSDDKVATDLSRLAGQDVVVTEKMDGENTTLYCDGYHARSLDSGYHPSRSWLAGWHAGVAHVIPKGWRVCGENLYARHSVAYDALPGYFLAFSVWDPADHCLAWDATMAWLAEREIPTVPVLYRGPLTDAALKALVKGVDPVRQEGFVIRTSDSFALADFPAHVVKWVRAGHVTAEQHWSKGPVVPNGLRQERAE